jgi:O-antigen/teichoic acid export membrane protein
LPFAFWLKPLFIRKFAANSPQLITWYYWFLPYGYFLLLYNILECYAASLKRTIITNFLKETALRILTLVLILLFVQNFINFETFIKFFSFLYAILTTTLIIYLRAQGEWHFTLTPSRVTKKFKKKMMVLAAFVFGGVIITTVSSTFDSLAISSKVKNGQQALAIFTIAAYISSIIQAPQRSLVAISIPHLAEAWRDKNLKKIHRIYERSSINLLLVALFLFGNIWLCYNDAISVFNMNPIYLSGKTSVLFLSLKLIVDMGTGVNGQIIGTSNYWRFEFFTGIVLLALIVPLNYLLIGKIGITGAAISNLVAYSIYNFIRVVFLWKKFSMQPFSINTLKALALGILTYLLIHQTCVHVNGLQGIILKTSIYSTVFIAAVWHLKITPDFEEVVVTIKKRIKRK